MSNQVGTLHEYSFHNLLKQWYKEPNDKLEMKIDNYVIDIVRDDLLIEIQTKNFSTIRSKLEKLLLNHRVRLIYPIIQDKWIIKLDSQWNIIGRRLSPSHNSYLDIFNELVGIPHLITNSNFTIEALLVQIEEIMKFDGKGSWRRKGWNVQDKKLIGILERKEFSTSGDFLTFIPEDLNIPFTNLELATTLNKSLKLAQKMSYCLRKMGLIKVVSKKGRAFLFGFEREL